MSKACQFDLEMNKESLQRDDVFEMDYGIDLTQGFSTVVLLIPGTG